VFFPSKRASEVWPLFHSMSNLWSFKMIAHYFRLMALQDYCFRTNKKRWAKAIGIEMRNFVLDNPQIRQYI
jgi:hypothetical protein